MGHLSDIGIDFDELEGVATAALFETVSDAEGWDDLSEEEKNGIRDSAVAVTKAAIKWMHEKGIALIPPGAFKKPTCREDAEHMLAAGMAWLKMNPPKVIPPKLIVPYQ